MHVIKHAHTHRHTNTADGGWEGWDGCCLPVVTGLLSWWCRWSFYCWLGLSLCNKNAHTWTRTLTPLFIDACTCTPFKSSLASVTAFRETKKIIIIQETERDFLQVWKSACVCVCMKVLCLNTPVRNSTTDPPRNAHETLACCILLQHAAHCLFLSLSPPITFPYHPHLPSLTPDTPFIENDVTHGLVIASVTAGISAKTSRVNKRCKPALIFICCRCKWMNPACTLPIPHMLKAT